MDSFKDKVAFITGGASGIGLGLAKTFAREGMKLAIADIDPAPLEAAAIELRALGAQVMTLTLDVTRWAHWEGLPEKVEAALGGPVRLLCNNAGISVVEQTVAETVVRDWLKVFDVNVNGVVYGVKAFAGRIAAAGGGHIVNTSSAGGLTGLGHAGLSAYVASKFAVVGLSEVLRNEMEAKQVGVSVFCPGPVRSELWRTSRKVRGVEVPDQPTARERRGSQAPDAMDPEQAGRLVLEAVRANRLYIVTHESRRAPVKARNAQVEAGFDVLG